MESVVLVDVEQEPGTVIEVPPREEEEQLNRIERYEESEHVSEQSDLGKEGKQQEITVLEQMQIMCDLYGFKQDTYWDCYRPDQQDALRNKLSLIVSNEFVTEKNLVNLRLLPHAVSSSVIYIHYA